MKAIIHFFLILPLAAEQAERLTLAKAREMALDRNPSIETARRRLGEADARIRQARSDYFPQLGFSGIAKAGLSGAMNALNPIGLANSPFFRNFATSLNASYTGLDFGRREHRVVFERRRRDALEADLSGREAEVLLETDRTYYNLLRAQRLRDVAQAIVASQESAVRQAQAFYDAQIRSRVDLDLARTALAGAQLRLLESNNDVRIRAAELGRLLGSDQGSAYLPEEADLTIGEAGSLESLLEEAIGMRPEMRSLAAEREAASERLSAARSQRKPQFSLAFAGGYARFAEVMVEQLLSVGLGLSFPIYTGGMLEGRIQEAEAALPVLDSRREELRQQIEFEVRRAYLQLETAHESIGMRKVQTESARQAVRLTSERYKERLGSAVEVNAAQANVAEAAAGEAAALYDAKVAESALRFAVGRR